MPSSACSRHPADPPSFPTRRSSDLELGLERGPGSFPIEALEERVVFRVAQVKGVQPLRQDLRQAALPHPDGSLDRNEPRRLVLGKVWHLIRPLYRSMMNYE